MQRPELPWGGGCRCGRVRIKVTEPPLLSVACHCTGCQRMTSSAFSMSVAIPTDGFAITQGETEIGGLHAEPKHHFCGWCMSWVFTQISGMGDFVNVRTTMLDAAQSLPPFVETFTREKLPWAQTPAKHSFAGFPRNEAWADLIAEYQAQS